jgi:hypothetical protein
VFGFNTVRSTADDTLHEVWNGNSVSARVAAVDKDGKYYSGAATAGDLLYAVTGAVTSVRRFDSLAIGTQYQVLRVNSGATAPEWSSNIGESGAQIGAIYATSVETTAALTVAGLTSLTNRATVQESLSSGNPPLIVKGGQLGGAEGGLAGIRCRFWGTANPYIEFETAGGSEGSETAIGSGVTIGRLQFEAHDGTTYGQVAYMNVRVVETQTATEHGGAIVFGVTPQNSTTPAPVLELSSNTSGNLHIEIKAPIQVPGNLRLIDNARKTGWSTATGSATRTTFVTSTVTLEQLAERVKALIDDLHATAGHGLIGT